MDNVMLSIFLFFDQSNDTAAFKMKCSHTNNILDHFVYCYDKRRDKSNNGRFLKLFQKP